MVSTSTSSIALLGVMLMASSTFIYYFYSKASSSNSSAPKKEESSSNSSAPEKEESSSNSSEPKVMASTSTTPIQKRFKYDVFISFSGEDTRKTFVGHLYQALKDKGIYTFKDDEEMKQGKTIDNQLIQTIKDSRFFIIVFSKNYASSPWCLDELVEIMECQKTGEQTAYPVFFHVKPTQVRKQSGAFGEAFFQNKNKDSAEKWIEALKGASNLVGRELQATANGHEAEFIKKIVGEISLELRSISFGFDEKLVGMETRVKDVVSYLEAGTDEVRMIGIKGMGGAGKTTTARAVFDHLSNDFEAKSFVGNVREVSNGSVSGLKNLQEQVLLNVLNEQVTLNSVEDGKYMIKKRMCGIKVLLVLDDVDDIDQLEALASGPNWFKPGSRIIVTTRDEHVLVTHRVNLIRDIDLLSDKEAICLFSRYAFGTENPVQGYEELSGKVVRYAAGLPLTLKVLGSFLCDKDKDEWKDAIERLKEIPLKETQKQLELSYISLEDDYKEIFLDIACILKGKQKEEAITILVCCGFHARIGLKVLEQRSLITVDKNGVLGMHDHIEEMGKNIVRREHPNEPNKHSRLWDKEKIEKILAADEGTEATICLELRNSNKNAGTVMKGLGKMKQLRYLHMGLNNTTLPNYTEVLDNTAQYFSNSLKYIKCTFYPFLYLPKTFQANNLVGLEMEDSRMVQLWEEGEKKVLPKLKFLSLSYSNLATFDFRITPNLEKLSLKGCDKLVEINAPVECLRKLVYLNLDSCLRFSNFVVFVGGLEPKVSRSSASLRLVGKSLDLCPLHPNINLPKFQFNGEYEENLPSSAGNIEKLISFGLCACTCTDFKKFSDMICSLRCLRKLELKCDIPEIPKYLGKLEFLEELRLSSTKIKHLPDSICMLKCLKSLKVKNGDLLEKLPENLGQLECLETLHVRSKKIKHLPDSICMLKCLKSLKVKNGDLLEKLPENLGQLECLETLHVWSKKIEYLPDSICMLKRLKSLDVRDCSCLGKLPEERLDLSATKIKHLPSSICMLKHHLPNTICMLKHLTYHSFHGCALLENLPEDLGKLECFKNLYEASTSFKYDVFLSFRGGDFCKNFVDHLYEALTAKGIYTYKDDVRIQKGKTISDQLFEAIEDSKFYIIVFSKNYASSSWCLNELVKIMECQKKDEHTVYPVFYDVEPTEVRNQIGAVENAFSKNKEKEAAEKWKGALKEAADLARWGLNDGDESELIKKLVGLISLELRFISFGSDQKLVGMETRVKDVVDCIEMGIDGDVWMIGIKGMGGAGKTTTARAVFDRLSADFEAKSFVANVREVSKPSMSGLKKLQEQVLLRVLNEQVTLDSVYDGKNMMQDRMHGIKVLLVLDDVDHIEQLEALAGGPNWFKPGSRIIVTTRNEQVLEAHRVNFRDIDLLSNKVDHRVKIRDIDLLSDEEAIFLLSRHAFGRASPSQGFEKLSEKVVSCAAGLPLTVKVLGSFLYGKAKHEWEDAIESLKEFS